MSARRATRSARLQPEETVEYIIARDSEEEDLQFEHVTDFEENLVEESLVEEYLTEEIDASEEAVFDGDPFGDVIDTEVSESVYTCNACGVEITNVQEHITEFHSDQEIIVDLGDKQKQDEYMTVVYKQEPPVELDSDSLNGYTYVEDDESQFALVDDTRNELGDGTVLLQTPDAKKVYNCVHCELTFTTLRSLSTHVLNEHKEKTVGAKAPTSVANEKLIRRARDRKTASGEQVRNEQICQICNTVFSSVKSLKLHARMHNPIKMKTLEDATEHEMAAIQEVDDGIREKFFCNICDKLYDKNFEDIHVQMHNGEEKFNCGICNKLFPDDTNLQMHMNAHQETRVIRTKAEVQNIKLPYACQYCSKEFARPYEKVKHERVHTGEKPYECEICGKCFRVSYCLTIHMRTHTDARPYVCPHCNKRFKAHSVYNHHLLTHSEQRNYKCPYCPKSFKTSVQLSGHKNSHTKPFSCTECSRPFGTLYAVRTHMETHNRPNNNMKHQCEICGAKYARSFALKDHIKEQHKDVQIIDIQSFAKESGAERRPSKRARTSAAAAKIDVVSEEEVDLLSKNEFISIEDERELEAAGQSILPNVVEQEITISEIEHFETEEEVVMNYDALCLH